MPSLPSLRPRHLVVLYLAHQSITRELRPPKAMDWIERHRRTIIGLLVALILVGGAVLVYRQTSLSGSTEVLIAPPSPEICVYVEGEVASPGVYVLRDGDRVVDAVEAAGGLTYDADQSAVNLAAPLRDGDQVHVYKIGEIPQKVNINTAEAWLLQLLPGIGETLARRIIGYRSENGSFREIEELKQVEGIGTATFEQLRDKITVR